MGVYRPLNGLKIAITSSRRAKELAHLISSHGGEPYIVPTVGIGLSKNLQSEAMQFIEAIKQGVDYAVFMTGPGVYSLFKAAKEMGEEEILASKLNEIIVVARSHKPKKALEEFGVRTCMVADENTAEGVAKLLLSQDIYGKTIAILWYGSYTSIIKDMLEKSGAKILDFLTYVYSTTLDAEGAEILREMGYDYVMPDREKVVNLIQEIIDNKIHVITFTSPPAVNGLFHIAEQCGLDENLRKYLRDNVIVVSIGPSTTSALEDKGITPDVVPQVGKMGHMVKALCEYVSARQSKAARILDNIIYVRGEE